MPTPPFQNTRLNEHEEPTRAKLEELFDALTRNLEHAYSEFATSSAVQEAKKRQALVNMAGRISAEGAIESGTGFTVTHPATGRYVITMKTALPALAILVATPANVLRTCSAPAASKSTWEVNISNTSTNTAENLAFNFVVQEI